MMKAPKGEEAAVTSCSPDSSQAKEIDDESPTARTNAEEEERTWAHH